MYKIVRKNDGKEFICETFKFVVFDELGLGTKMIDNIELDTCLILPPFSMFTLWMTSIITEILFNDVEIIHFKTKNSEYVITPYSTHSK